MIRGRRWRSEARAAREQREEDRGTTASSSSHAAATVTDAYGGVPEPALSEPAQQLIGARSGGERGYYRTTTPRFGEKFDFVSVEREEKKGKINKT